MDWAAKPDGKKWRLGEALFVTKEAAWDRAVSLAKSDGGIARLLDRLGRTERKKSFNELSHEAREVKGRRMADTKLSPIQEVTAIIKNDMPSLLDTARQARDLGNAVKDKTRTVLNNVIADLEEQNHDLDELIAAYGGSNSRTVGAEPDKPVSPTPAPQNGATTGTN